MRSCGEGEITRAPTLHSSLKILGLVNDIDNGPRHMQLSNPVTYHKHTRPTNGKDTLNLEPAVGFGSIAGSGSIHESPNGGETAPHS